MRTMYLKKMTFHEGFNVVLWLDGEWNNLQPGDHIRLKKVMEPDDTEETCNSIVAHVKGVFMGNLDELAFLLAYAHDPACRTMEGATHMLAQDYPFYRHGDSLTAVVFKPFVVDLPPVDEVFLEKVEED